MTRESSSRTLIAIVAASLVALAALQATAAGSRSTIGQDAQRVATVGVITTKDFRVAVVAKRLTSGAAPTAEVRVGMARRVGTSWRELGERRLTETYFWHTVRGPRAVCRLQIATAGRGASFRPSVIVQLLQSPSLGCGRSYRISLGAR
jgi:hypothetical protein